MALPLANPSVRPLYVLLLAWTALIAASWLVPAVLGLEPATGWLAFLALQAVATALAVAVAAAALRRRIDLSRAVFGASFLPLLWGLGVALWLGGLLYLAS